MLSSCFSLEDSPPSGSCEERKPYFLDCIKPSVNKYARQSPQGPRTGDTGSGRPGEGDKDTVGKVAHALEPGTTSPRLLVDTQA